MPRFQKKPEVITAHQWTNNKEHSQVIPYLKRYPKSYFQRCPTCGIPFSEHGWIETLEGGHIVCPSDWIIEGIQGEYYPCKPDIFEKTYTRLDF